MNDQAQKELRKTFRNSIAALAQQLFPSLPEAEA
jgi:hypothetical protein